jgi:hypothetical protein
VVAVQEKLEHVLLMPAMQSNAPKLMIASGWLRIKMSFINASEDNKCLDP